MMDYTVLEKAYWSMFRVVRLQQKLLSHHFGDSLVLPKIFVENLKERLGTSATLKTRNGSEWVVKMETGANGDVLLTSGWKEFAQAHRLKKDDTVMFKHSGNFEFKVTMFDGETGGENVLGHYVNNKELVVALESRNELGETMLQHVGEPPDANSPNICEYPRTSARAEAERTQSCVKKQSERISDAVRKRKQRCLRKARALKIAKSDEYVVYLCTSYVNPGHVLTFSGKWAEKHGLDRQRDVELHLDGKTWPVRVLLRDIGQAEMRSGWRDFVIGNGLQEGDVCLFTVIPGSGDHVTINVRIVRVVNDVTEASRDGNGNSNGWNELEQAHCLKKGKTGDGNVFGNLTNNLELHPHAVELETLNDLNEASRRCKLEHTENSDQFWETMSHHDKEARNADSLNHSQCPSSGETKSCCEKKQLVKRRSGIWKKEQLKRAQALEIARPDDYVVYLSASYVKYPYILCLSGEWGMKHGFDRPREVELHRDGKVWPVRVFIRQLGSAGMSSGWKEFVVDNGLEEGDVCFFTVVPGLRDHVTINVRIVRVSDVTTASNDDGNDNGTGWIFPEPENFEDSKLEQEWL